MKIPKSFQVAGKTYTVKFSTEQLSDRQLVGLCDYATCEVFLSKTDHGSIQVKEDIEQIFLHEIWHVIWDALGELKMKKNEQKADAFCSLLHQVLNSGKGELKHGR